MLPDSENMLTQCNKLAQFVSSIFKAFVPVLLVRPLHLKCALSNKVAKPGHGAAAPTPLPHYNRSCCMIITPLVLTLHRTRFADTTLLFCINLIFQCLTEQRNRVGLYGSTKNNGFSTYKCRQFKGGFLFST